MVIGGVLFLYPGSGLGAIPAGRHLGVPGLAGMADTADGLAIAHLHAAAIEAAAAFYPGAMPGIQNADGFFVELQPAEACFFLFHNNGNEDVNKKISF